MRYFVAVAEELHFARAAARLHISAPPLSQRIGELEDELGVRLFDRTSRRVALTPAGERLLVEARTLIEAADHFEQVARQSARTGPSTLAVGYCHGSETGAFRLIRAFRSRHPDTPVRPDALTTLRSIDAIRTDRASVAIVRPPIPGRRTLASRPLARVAMDHVAVPIGHPLAAEEVIDAAQLEGEPVLLVERADAPTAHDETVGYCTALGVRPAWVLHPATQAERMLDMVAVGHGDRMAQPLAGRAHPAGRRGGAPAGTGRALRRVPPRLAGRRSVGRVVRVRGVGGRRRPRPTTEQSQYRAADVRPAATSRSRWPRLPRERAARCCCEGLRRPKEVVVKGRTDIVTWADGAAQTAIVEVIGAAFPDHHIVGEEGTGW